MDYRQSAIKYLLSKNQINKDETDSVEVTQGNKTFYDVTFVSGGIPYGIHMAKRLLEQIGGNAEWKN